MAPWPTEVRFNKARAELLIRNEDGSEGTIPYELLRIESPSAETQGHGADRPPPPVKKRNVSVLSAEPVGRYALRITFSDGHNTGLYTWAYLSELAAQKTERMAAYLARLKELGLSRD